MAKGKAKAVPKKKGKGKGLEVTASEAKDPAKALEPTAEPGEALEPTAEPAEHPDANNIAPEHEPPSKKPRIYKMGVLFSGSLSACSMVWNSATHPNPCTLYASIYCSGKISR